MKVSVRVTDSNPCEQFFFLQWCEQLYTDKTTWQVQCCESERERDRECNFSFTFTCILHQPKGPKPDRSTLWLGRYESVCRWTKMAEQFAITTPVICRGISPIHGVCPVDVPIRRSGHMTFCLSNALSHGITIAIDLCICLSAFGSPSCTCIWYTPLVSQHISRQKCIHDRWLGGATCAPTPGRPPIYLA
jgi:hypothetical protein